MAAVDDQPYKYEL